MANGNVNETLEVSVRLSISTKRLHEPQTSRVLARLWQLHGFETGASFLCIMLGILTRNHGFLRTLSAEIRSRMDGRTCS